MLGSYFPRPFLNENENVYLSRVSIFKKKNREIEIPKKVITFLKLFFRINQRNNFAISYAKGKVKHETPNKFGRGAKTKLIHESKSDYPNLFKKNGDNSINIGNGAIIVDGMSNIKMHDIAIFNSSGMAQIDKLEISATPFEGNKIIFNGNIKIKFVDWASDCINICREFIEQLEKVHWNIK